MLKSVEGVYRDGKVELKEVPAGVCDESRVIIPTCALQSLVPRSSSRQMTFKRGCPRSSSR